MKSKSNPQSPSPVASTGGIAIISDIHANIDALAEVLTDIATQRCFTIFCLGDTIGYGPEPAACAKYMREFADINLLGNHEAMYMATKQTNKDRLQPKELGDLWASLDLCHRQIESSDSDWIDNLPLVVPVAEMELVHASLYQPPMFEYIFDKKSARQNFSSQKTRVSFHGHTHVPAIWQEAGEKITCHTPGEDPINLDPDCRYAICVGSVGQPRDHDPRACYVIYHPGADQIEFRRVPYDIKKAQARFAKAGLKKFDAARIAKGE